MNDDRIKRAQAAVQSLVYLPTLRYATDNAITQSASKNESNRNAEPLQKGIEAKFRPWDRQDLNERLRTYKACSDRPF